MTWLDGGRPGQARRGVAVTLAVKYRRPSRGVRVDVQPRRHVLAASEPGGFGAGGLGAEVRGVDGVGGAGLVG
jgi:hypothetical protein